MVRYVGNITKITISILCGLPKLWRCSARGHRLLLVSSRSSSLRIANVYATKKGVPSVFVHGELEALHAVKELQNGERQPYNC